MNENILKQEEKIIFDLRDLYHKYGYQQYKMNKFEEYDLYSQNKDFLISDNIITFNDTDGKLLALKPDVTLSIVRNNKNTAGLQKVYYNESIYRVSKFSKMYKEITQVGIECLGEVDDYIISENLVLALKSLQIINNEFILAISHLSILKEMISRLDIDRKSENELIKCIDSKSLHQLDEICKDGNQTQLAVLKQMLNLDGDTESALSFLQDNLFDSGLINQLERILSIIDLNGFKSKVKIDFSIVSDMNYYNGIAFKGFIKGLPTRVLAGGQYDNLMRKMKSKSKSIGFAVYLDLLERINPIQKGNDVDVILIYTNNDSIKEINTKINEIISRGKTVIATKVLPLNLKYGEVIYFSKQEV